MFDNLAKKISGLKDPSRNKSRKGLSIISEMAQIPFEFHEGTHFDTFGDLFDKNFRCE